MMTTTLKDLSAEIWERWWGSNHWGHHYVHVQPYPWHKYHRRLATRTLTTFLYGYILEAWKPPTAPSHGMGPVKPPLP
jgi:hypothetical protein